LTIALSVLLPHDEIDDLDRALGIAVTEGRLDADLATKYLHYSMNCEKLHIDRVNIVEFKTRHIQA
jgi:hypothetical protein